MYFVLHFTMYMADRTSYRTCLGTYNPKNEFFTDVSLGNDYRSWTWIVYASHLLI